MAKKGYSSLTLYPKYISKKKFRFNHMIRSLEVRVIGENNEQFGVIPTQEALAKAQSLGLDLVEVSPLGNPPVCKILDYGKFMYQQEKNERKNKSKTRKTEIKGLRLTLKMGEHDRDVRKNQAGKFFDQGHKVKIEMILKGREKGKFPQAKELIENFIAALGSEVFREGSLTAQGGKLSIIVYRK